VPLAKSAVTHYKNTSYGRFSHSLLESIMNHFETDDCNLQTRLERAASEPFEGWDFSRLQGRMIENRPTWNYEDVVRDASDSIGTMLDMDTGGGEVLSNLQPLPPYTVATEGYPPNVPIARARLEPLGIQVVRTIGNQALPFPTTTFDLVTNRHGGYRPEELFRILKSGGLFITQQVGSSNLQDLNRWLGSPSEVPEWTVDRARHELEDAGLVIVRAEESFLTTQFRDVEAVVYYLKAIPWQIPDFTIWRYFQHLKGLDQELRSKGWLEANAHRFLLITAKPH